MLSIVRRRLATGIGHHPLSGGVRGAATRFPRHASPGRRCLPGRRRVRCHLPDRRHPSLPRHGPVDLAARSSRVHGLRPVYGGLPVSGTWRLADLRARLADAGGPGRNGPLQPVLHSARDGGGTVSALAGDGESARLAGQLRERIARTFRRSLQIRHLDVGSSNGCDWEINALLNPVYDVQRFGIDFVASPRHADLLLVTGPVTRHLEPALWATYEATPDPKLVVAVGACACSGGVVADSYATAGGVDRRLPVDVYIPGCPPRPEAILHGLLLALDRREQKVRPIQRTVVLPLLG